MRIGITGGNGFIGWHLQCYLKTLSEVVIVEVADRETFSSFRRLSSFVKNKDVIFHLAGVNRADSDDEIVEGNKQPAVDLVAALKKTRAKPHIIYTSTTHAEAKQTVYGKAKALVAEIISKWANASQVNFSDVILPHVFGEYCRPNYNSAVGTFCHQIANGKKPSITSDSQLELLHVQDVVEQLFELFKNECFGAVRLKGQLIGVVEVAEKLQLMYQSYRKGVTPKLSKSLDRSLFNSLRAAIPMQEWLTLPKLHEDDRGWLVETIKVGSGGQSFVSSTKPGITRGNHFHRRKYERFFVLKGDALIKMRKIGCDQVLEFPISGEQPMYIDIPTLYTHNITNVGDKELITFFWTDEFYDPEKPDTFFEIV